MAYATTVELADYLGVSEAELSDDAERLLDRASEMVDYMTLYRIDDTIIVQATAAQKATCAQYEWWSQFDEFNTANFLSSISIGPFSASINGQSSSIPNLAPRANQYLFEEGLLYKGVDMT